jgi:class 3 adenylate cyclase
MGEVAAVDAYAKAVADTEKRRRATARRVVRMGLAMQEVVARKAAEHGVDVGVRIGVHTGKVMGGIIGTVKFHFDMWGNGVIGAVRMEELGAKGHVHISNTTAHLLGGVFNLKEAPNGYDDAFEQLYGIRASYFVEKPSGRRFSECKLPTPSFLRRRGGALTSSRDDQRESGSASGIDENLSEDVIVQNMGNFVSALQGSAVSTEDSSEPSGGSHHDTTIPTFPTSRLRRMQGCASMLNLFASGLWSKTHETQLEGRIRLKKWRMDRRVSTSGKSHTGGARDSAASLMFQTEMAEDLKRKNARAEDEAKEFRLHLQDAQQFGLRICEALVALAAFFGLYDTICGYYSFFVSPGAPSQLTGILAVRYIGMLVLLVLLRVGVRLYEPHTIKHAQISASLFAAIPAVGVAGMILCAGAEVYPCREGDLGDNEMLACNGASVADGRTNASQSCLLSVQDGVALCERAPMDYVTTLIMIHAFLPYTFAFVPQSHLMTTAAGSTGLGLIALFVNLWVVHRSNGRAPPGTAEWLMFAFWVFISHMIGMAHQAARHTDIWEKSALRLRQARMLRSVREETEHCERLLANILPNHLLGSLGAQVLNRQEKPADDDTTADGGSVLINIEANGHTLASPGASQPTPKLSRGVLVCESYEDCSFLFAKISGLAQLVNDEGRAPTEVMHVLQVMFDRFDALADMYGVQKVRKTANEYYLVAAGLPNPEILPTAEDRACGIAAYGFAMITIMHILNLELKKHGVAFSVQIGIHSVNAIAGVVGHKTVQYDLCGDAVNTAARMCSYSLPDHVHVSEATYQLLKHKFGAVCRGVSEIKGKGKMNTYLLVNLPSAQEEIVMEHRTALGHSAVSA